MTEPATQFIAFPLGIFFGGLTMLLVSMWEVVRRNALGATAFGTYGAFWISAGVSPPASGRVVAHNEYLCCAADSHVGCCSQAGPSVL